MKPNGPIIAGFFLMLLATPALAQVNDLEQARQYRYCTELAAKEPSKALSEAMSWRDLGGGVAAEHCLAKAQIGMGELEQAALRLENLANDVRLEARLRPDLFAQAGQVWMMADNPARAEAAFAAALELSPNTTAYFIDRATARAALGIYKEAVADLNRAIEQDTNQPDAFVYRASALRNLGRDRDAWRDIKSALSLNPNHLEGLLERGILHQTAGEKGAARKDWLKVLTLAPDSPAAEVARDRLAAMDVAIEPEAKE